MHPTHDSRCLTNLQRIRHLPKTTQLRKIYDEGTWHHKPYTFYDYTKIEENTIARLKYTPVSLEDFRSTMEEPPSQKGKKAIKDIFLASERAKIKHRLRLNHAELTQGFEPSQSHPLWKRSAPKISSYIKWITGASTELADSIHYDIDGGKSCRLCNSECEETRDHLLSECDGTSTARRKLCETLEKTSVEKFDE